MHPSWNTPTIWNWHPLTPAACVQATWPFIPPFLAVCCCCPDSILFLLCAVTKEAEASTHHFTVTFCPLPLATAPTEGVTAQRDYLFGFSLSRPHVVINTQHLLRPRHHLLRLCCLSPYMMSMGSYKKSTFSIGAGTWCPSSSSIFAFIPFTVKLFGFFALLLSQKGKTCPLLRLQTSFHH